MLTKQMKMIARLFNGGKPLFASISFIWSPATGIMVRPLRSIVKPANNPVINTLLKFGFMCLNFWFIYSGTTLGKFCIGCE